MNRQGSPKAWRRPVRHPGGLRHADLAHPGVRAMQFFTTQPFLTTAQGTRRFAYSAVAVQAIIVNADERVLLLSSPTKNRPNEWQVISSGLEAAETVLAGVLREVREEAA